MAMRNSISLTIASSTVSRNFARIWTPQVKKLFLPNGVVDLDYQAPAYHGFCRGVHGNATSHGGGPSSASEFFLRDGAIEFQFCERLRCAFHADRSQF